MSQQKVDKYKKEKYSRKQQLAKEKRQRVIYRITGCVAAAAIVGWIGFSVYARVEENRPVSYTEVSLDAINDYMSAQ
ncbi:MAG: hypothetical protein K2N87_20440 [Eubacterium sp.]|nr:hypothetical protein [Eubacterium sp.]